MDIRAVVMTIPSLTAAFLSCVLLVSCSQHEAAPAATTGSPPGIQYEAHISAGGRAPSGLELNSPLRADLAAAKNGATLFTAMNCDGCHGGDASGWVGPSLADGRWRYGGADAEVFSSIYFGRPKGMPAFGATLGTSAIWSIVAYLRTLNPPADDPTESWEEASGASTP
jgi:cytochrome c oxidase cbb3-type subunit III